MDFSHRKLPNEAAQTLRLCPIQSVAPYALMLAPVYVYMKRNEKFVAVKAPLDFFTPEELEKLRPLESFFIPEFVDSAIPFRDAGRRVRSLLSLPVQPAPYELSDATLRTMGPLWGNGAVIEPFFIAIFANEVCDLLPGDLLKSSRDGNLAAYETGIIRSALTVFLALHLGYCDLDFLNQLRLDVFKDALSGKETFADALSERDELRALAGAILRTSSSKIVKAEFFAASHGTIAVKLVARMERVKAQMIRAEQPVPTIYGAKGFVDV
jgi:hypothetical protein